MIAIIPARGGSKGLPGKNVKKLEGIPLIGYTIKAALDASPIEAVYVTTDSEEIANVSREYGAEVPFLRPALLSSDTASAIDVYLHIVEYLRKNVSIDCNKFMVLLPTVPFRNSKHINEAFSQYINGDYDTLVSVKEAPVPPSWFLEPENDKYIKPCGFGIKKGVTRNRQENKRYYIPNGAIYILDYDILKEKRTYYTEKTGFYVMSNNDSVDIDTIEDFKYAEYIARMMKQK